MKPLPCPACGKLPKATYNSEYVMWIYCCPAPPDKCPYMKWGYSTFKSDALKYWNAMVKEDRDVFLINIKK